MVDDNAGDIVLARRCFDASRLRNPWLSFTSGKQLLDYLKTVKGGTSPMPAIVLLDLNMPVMNGFEVLATVRGDEFFRTLPIFCMLTSSSNPMEMERAQKLGASGFVTKPGNMNNYIEFFNSLAPA